MFSNPRLTYHKAVNEEQNFIIIDVNASCDSKGVNARGLFKRYKVEGQFQSFAICCHTISIERNSYRSYYSVGVFYEPRQKR
ncbi:hypothetical protein CMI42_00185 [Candidatus Pacearchaeota archaeon]|nr:hypothetical protein [Candidatus Pacearchaeota archaeon]